MGNAKTPASQRSLKRLVMALALCGTLAGCDFSSKTTYAPTPAITMHTVEHDGHTWVITNVGGVSHHPGCKCHNDQMSGRRETN